MTAYPPEMLAPVARRHFLRSDGSPFRVLVVDDEHDIYGSSRIALKNQAIGGRPIVVEAAQSAEEGRRMLRQDAYALALVDIVMESREAGLLLAGWTRGELADPFVRLVVRTGQPGVTTESQVVRDFDLGDFRAKSMSAVAFTTLVTGQLRSYQAIVSYAAQAWIARAEAEAALARASGMDRTSSFAAGAARLLGGDIAAVETTDTAAPGYSTMPDGAGFTLGVPGLSIRVEGAFAPNSAVAEALVSIARIVAVREAPAA